MLRPALLALLSLACGGASSLPDAAPDASATSDAAIPDAGPLAHCQLAPLPATAGAGGTVTAGPLHAGAAEARLDLPVGSALGAFTGRASLFIPPIDTRVWPWSGVFHPSIGIETAPMARALALEAGGETVVLIKADLGVGFDGLTHDLAERLGLPGKVLLAVSHTHSGWGHHTPNPAMGLAFSRFRRAQYDALLEVLEATARTALDARRPARLAVLVDDTFDPGDEVTRDRRGENDELAGGPRKDHHLALLRLDGTDGKPIAVVPIFGVHGTVLDYDNPLASTDASGAIERALEESFDEPVVVMHLQGAAGDVSPATGRGLDCTGVPGCHDFAAREKVGRAALPHLRRAWADAEALLVDTLAIEMLTRSIELGPRPETFTVRGGALAYAPWDGVTPGDGRIFDEAGAVISPVDEFNAPAGAALCGGGDIGAVFPPGNIPGTAELAPYRACLPLDIIGDLVGRLFGVDLATTPTCASTRTTVAALRLGEHLVLALPGEPVTLLADRVRALSPAGADRTIVLGYAQGHVGYLLTADDWLRAGFEPSINFWGPLEGEHIAEQAAQLGALALTPAREDGAAGGVDRWLTPATSDDRDVPPVAPAPLRGTIPQVIPGELWLRPGAVLEEAQPPAELARLGTARFVWIGEDPRAGTPIVTLQRELEGAFVDVTRRSGRKVQDGDLLRSWTPIPLRPTAGEAVTHHWVAEWQAVPWTGELDERAAVPLGRYRFHVAGTGYTLTSRPFTVVPAELRVTLTATGLAAALSGEGGFRLLDARAASNRDVPLRGASVHLVWRGTSGEPVGELEATLDGEGHLVVAPPESATSVTVEDRAGNRGSARR